MKEEDAKKRINVLAAELEHHAELYYKHDAPEISDEAYDSLYTELVSLEQAFPHLKTKKTITQQVGGTILEGFTKVSHNFPQWSFDNIFSYTELQKWEEKVHKLILKEIPDYDITTTEYVVELKIDGLKVILDYDNGVFVRGATRGNGSVGEDITENLKMVTDIPKTIDEKRKLSCVGEAWIEKSEFEKINTNRAQGDLAPYANPRNLAAGTLRQLDTSIVKKRNLKVFAYDFHSDDVALETHDQELEFLKSNSFNVNQQYLVSSQIKDIQHFYDDWVNKRHHQSFGVDGLVIKLNNMALCKKLGYTAKAPRFAVAYKFPAEQQTTIVKDITLQVGRTGVITPVAELQEVTIDGSVVKRATLHNFDEIDRLGLLIGDTVIVEKAGDIIPKIKKVMVKMRTGNEHAFDFQERIKEMSLDVRKEVSSSGVNSWYVDRESDEMKIRQLSYFASKKAFNIEGMGEKHVRALYEAGFINKASDIFNLTSEQILSLPLFKEKATGNLLTAIENAKSTDLSTFITALGIRHVGEEVASIYADHYKNLENFLGAQEEELINLHGIGAQIAESTIAYLSDENNKQEIRNIAQHLILKEKQKSQQHLEGLSFVVTGSLTTFTRESIKSYLKESGAKAQSQVSAQTNYLIAGEKAGSKLTKAKNLNIPILSEDEFIKNFVK